MTAVSAQSGPRRRGGKWVSVHMSIKDLMLEKRKTSDIVIIVFSVMVASTVFSACLILVIGKVIHPEMDVSKGVAFIGNVLTTVTGALVGFIGGKATGRLEANGV